jgi:RNA polymerase sigma-70 factor (ECF subfamily)
VQESEAFEALCRGTYEQLVRAAYLIVGDVHEAEDLAQEALARAFERWRQVSRYDRPEAWVQRVLTNLAISSARRRARRRRLPWSSDVPAPETSDPVVVAAIRALAPQQRAVLALRYLCDRSVAETAEILGKPEGTVRSITSQALGRLRRSLPDEVRNEEAWS